MTGPLLSLRGVTKQFRSGDSIVTVLRGVDLDLHPGEFSALVGPSGSGKSTLLLLAGLLEPATSGEIAIEGRQLDIKATSAGSLRAIRRQKVGFVFQKPNLVPFLTASENVELVLAINGYVGKRKRDLAAGFLADLDLSHRLNQYPKRLSGGEQQRVAIARAIANGARIILADEPTAALDAVRGEQAMLLLKAFAERLQAAVLVVTHDQRSLHLFDRVLQMSDGKLT